MARARNIKPALFDNDQLAEIEPLGRLLFIGLWTIADYKGDLVYREKRIKAQLLPYDNCDIKNIMINLDKSGFVRFYSDGEQVYVNITNFSKHQNPHKNEKVKGSSIPEYTESMSQAVDLTTLTINLDKNGTDQDNNETNRADSLLLIPDSLSPITDSPPETVVVASAPKFNFKSELLALGVDKDILSDWLIVRKNKKASNTKTALTKILNQIAKTDLTVSQAVEFACSNDWKGFEASWYLNKTGKQKDILAISAASDWHLEKDEGF